MYIREWQERLNNIYGFNNERLSPDYKMLHFSTKCSEMGRLFNHRKIEVYDSDLFLLKAISWLIALCNHFEIDLEDTLLKCFPHVCSYCISSPCICTKTNKRAIDIQTGQVLDEEDYNNELEMKRNALRNTGTRLSFDDFSNLLDKIYPVNRTLINHGFYSFALGKLDEEKGEVHHAFSKFLLAKADKRYGEQELKNLKEDIEAEIADVAAWLISFWNPLHKLDNKIELKMMSMYIDSCPACKENPCSCPHYSISVSEEELLKEINILAEDLKKSLSINTLSINKGDEEITTPLTELQQNAIKLNATPNKNNKENFQNNVLRVTDFLKKNASNLTPVAELVEKFTNVASKILQTFN